jgi:predicted SprT family Zn-dependent metalloprotease
MPRSLKAAAATDQLTLPWDGISLSVEMPRERPVESNASTQTANLRSPEGLTHLFERVVKRNVKLVITDNATSLFSMRPSKAGAVSVRLHHMFLRAGDEVLGELARYIRSGRGRTPLFWRFVKENTHLLKERPPRRETFSTEGRRHDLLDIYERLNREFFAGEILCRITWGRRGKRRIRRSRTLGSYSPHSNIIRINPALDSLRVPRFFVEYIVFHEMLHALLGVEERNGRRTIHSQDFRALERRFPHYERAMAWERRNRL